MKSSETTQHSVATPIRQSERYAILDILRGLALFGIIIVNFPEFSLYSFLDKAIFSNIRLHYFNFDPLEWIWCMLTYGRYFSLEQSEE